MSEIYHNGVSWVTKITGRGDGSGNARNCTILDKFMCAGYGADIASIVDSVFITDANKKKTRVYPRMNIGAFTSNETTFARVLVDFISECQLGALKYCWRADSARGLSAGDIYYDPNTGNNCPYYAVKHIEFGNKSLLDGMMHDDLTYCDSVTMSNCGINFGAPIVLAFNGDNQTLYVLSEQTMRPRDMSYAFGGDARSVAGNSFVYHILSFVEDIKFDNIDFSLCTTMNNMCRNVNNLKSITWPANLTTPALTDTSYMFYTCSSLTNPNTEHLTFDNVTNAAHMFEWSGIKAFDGSRWNTSSLTTTAYMFESCTSLETVNFSNWDTSSVTTMAYMFDRCLKLKQVDASMFDVSRVTTMAYMFADCRAMTSVNMSNWNTVAVKTYKYMFYRCYAITSIDVSSWNTINMDIDGLTYTFASCTSLKTVTGFDTLAMLDKGLLYTFSNCISLEEQALPRIYLSTLTQQGAFTGAFSGCTALKLLDLTNISVKVLTEDGYNLRYILANASTVSNDFALEKIITPGLTRDSKGPVNLYFLPYGNYREIWPAEYDFTIDANTTQPCIVAGGSVQVYERTPLPETE